MTVTPNRTAMPNTTIPIVQKPNSKVSNFTVASLLADTRTTSSPSPPSPMPTSKMALLYQSDTSPRSQNNENSNASCTKIDNIDRSHTPQSSVGSVDEYDSNQEDSIVDIEDIHNDDGSEIIELDRTKNIIQSNVNGPIPIRPTPFSALAAAAAAWSGIGGNVQWSATRQLAHFGSNGNLFHAQNFGGPQISAGKRIHL